MRTVALEVDFYPVPSSTRRSPELSGIKVMVDSKHRKNTIDQAPGVYSSDIGLDGICRSSWKSSLSYWSSGEWNSRFRFFSSMPEISSPTIYNFTFVNNDQEVYYMCTLLNNNLIVQDLLDVSGQRISRIWNSHDWVTFSYKPKYQCDVYAVCGPFTICTGNANTLCECMKRFSERSPEDWKVEDRTGGCKRNTPLNCGSHSDKNSTGTTDTFYSIPSIRLPHNSKRIPNASSWTECARVCLNNCSCTAYSYGKDRCSIWHDELASGLAYLHHSCRDCIIHCDIKPENILLDTCFVPKIADFGMAKFLGREFSHVVTTMRGTIGYLAPEWISGTSITLKVDVYSYGMLLLEIVSGSRNLSKEASSDGDHASYFLLKVTQKLLDGDIVSLVDANLHDGVNIEEVARVCIYSR
uniref:Protein kinase domain-containing protein n=1 Tax=Setaria viridis TaxID=4556 RepID=A0A4U6USJ5_SETVI|nr:hypothetical protein SEVIR_4G016400v2 [Setaria viridis]